MILVSTSVSKSQDMESFKHLNGSTERKMHRQESTEPKDSEEEIAKLKGTRIFHECSDCVDRLQAAVKENESLKAQNGELTAQVEKRTQHTKTMTMAIQVLEKKLAAVSKSKDNELEKLKVQLSAKAEEMKMSNPSLSEVQTLAQQLAKDHMDVSECSMECVSIVFDLQMQLKIPLGIFNCI